MFDSIVGAIFFVGGFIAFWKAKDISAFEKRLAGRYRWTRVTGWSGTSKGVLLWRVLGAVLVFEGLGLIELAVYYHLSGNAG